VERTKLDKQAALKLYKELSSYENQQYISHQKNCASNRSFYFGDQLTVDELEDIKARGQFPYAINKVRKAVRGITGMLTASLPKFKFVAVGDSDNSKAALCNNLLDWVWRNSDDIQGFQKVIKRATIDNIAYFHVIRDRRGYIKYVPLTYADVVVDPNSKDSMFRDAYRIAIKKYIPVELAKVLYGIDNLQMDNPLAYSDMINTDGTQAFLGKIFSADRNYVLVYETYRKQYVAVDNNFAEVRIIKETLVGFEDMFTETLDPAITEYPIIPVYAEDTENPYKLGEVYFMKAPQKFINKAYGVALYNAQLLSNPKVLVRETDIPGMDIESFEDNFSTPGAIGVLTGNAGDPIIVQGQPLNSAFFTMYQDAVHQFEQATLPSEVLGFNNSSGRQRVSQLLDIKETVLDTFKDFASNIEKAVAQLGKVSLQYIKAYLKKETVIKINDGEDKFKQIELNKQQGLDMNNPKSVESFVKYLRSQGVSDNEIEQRLNLAMENKEYADSINYIINDINNLEYDVYVIPGSYSPTYKMAILRLMMELYEMNAVDNTAIIENAPIGNKEEMLNRFSENRRLYSENEELKAQIQSIEEVLKSREKELADLGIKNVITEAKFKQEKIIADTRLKAYLSKQRNKLISTEMINKIRDEVRDIQFAAKVEKAKAELAAKTETEVGESAEALVARLFDQRQIEENL
jgi:hypothetical protein